MYIPADALRVLFGPSAKEPYGFRRFAESCPSASCSSGVYRRGAEMDDDGDVSESGEAALSIGRPAGCDAERL